MRQPPQSRGQLSAWPRRSRCARLPGGSFPDVRHRARGTVKKTDLAAYANPRLLGGIIGINLEAGDRLLAVRETDGSHEILLATAKGFAIRFPEADVRPMGRATFGVNGIRLRSGDRVVGMASLRGEQGGEVLGVTARTFGKRTPIEEYRRQNRGGLGIINHKINDKTGEVISTKHVLPGEGLMLITQTGMILRINVAGVRIVGRSTQGVKLMDLEPGDRLVSVARLAEEVKLGEEPGAENAEMIVNPDAGGDHRRSGQPRGRGRAGSPRRGRRRNRELVRCLRSWCVSLRARRGAAAVTPEGCSNREQMAESSLPMNTSATPQ